MTGVTLAGGRICSCPSEDSKKYVDFVNFAVCVPAPETFDGSVVERELTFEYNGV